MAGPGGGSKFVGASPNPDFAYPGIKRVYSQSRQRNSSVQSQARLPLYDPMIHLILLYSYSQEQGEYRFGMQTSRRSGYTLPTQTSCMSDRIIRVRGRIAYCSRTKENKSCRCRPALGPFTYSWLPRLLVSCSVWVDDRELLRP